MEKSTKILLAVGGTLVAGVGGYFIYRAVAKKTENEKLVGNSNKEGNIDTVTPITSPSLTPEQVGVPTINPASTQPTIPSLATMPTMPSFNLGDFGNTTTTEETPTSADYIRMADKYMTWDNVYKFAEKLGVSDKKKVHIGGDDTTAIITKLSRDKFSDEVVSKFPDWKKLIKAKAKEKGIDILSETEYAKWNTDSYSFSGSQKNNGNFWTSRR